MRPASDPSLPRMTRATARLVGVLWLAALPGCGAGSPGRPGGEPSRELPAALAALLPRDAEVAHYESAGEPVPYRLWLLGGPGGELVGFPDGLADLERHVLPGAVLSRLIDANAPRLAPGEPRGGTCRFSHWTDGDAEYRLREFVTDRGWFASLEQFRSPAGPG
ncbi:hypothetical protein [Tautonia plasticadhaerens]|uniref:Uncharacterized protein n=1 Tax=Tautonia plasticadhaerens TaxID=2527974 RepID=A0A518GVC1_9BACT|nr:hypothetical protein [Tautonia plasticadhaerens]QDV32524.1 hypothetical protein ElP_03570 [Tautonia plasticadhaerens]